MLVSLIFLCGKKKAANAKEPPVPEKKKTTTDSDPPSKRCNSQGGLLADDPDLKSLQRKQIMIEQEAKAAAAAARSKVVKEEGEMTDLRSFEDDGGPKKKENKDASTKPQMPEAMSAYAKPQSEANGMSMLALNANNIDKEKLPVKLLPKEKEVVAQDSTQDDTPPKNKESKIDQQKAKSKRKTESLVSGQKSCQKRLTKKKNDGTLPDCVVDLTQSIEEGTQMPTKCENLPPSTKQQKRVEQQHNSRRNKSKEVLKKEKEKTMSKNTNKK
uniref:Natural killer-tumor recognition protein n=1 Tax=Panagrolaimus sp. JU765 TaxID=591449 RepID=A0AC34RRX5_9BILA